MTTGVMYDAAYIPLSAILAAKPVVMSCYTDGAHAAPASTVKTLLNAGIGIWPNHENAANQLLGGNSAGRAAATAAVAAVIGWGLPANGTVDIVYSVDVDVPAGPTTSPSAEFQAIGEAFDGINAVHAGRFIAKVYGEGALINYLVTTGRVKVGNWLSASTSFPGFSVNNPNVAVWQQVGTDIGSTDRDVITHLEFINAYWSGARPAGAGTLIGDDMLADNAASNTKFIQDAMMGCQISVPDGKGGTTSVSLLQWAADFRTAYASDIQDTEDKVTAIQVAVNKLNNPTIDFDATAAAKEIATVLGPLIGQAGIDALKAQLNK